MAAPVFDATAVSAASGFNSSGTVALSWSHTVGGGANNYGIVACVIGNGGAANFNPNSSTVTIGASTLTLLASGILMGGSVVAGVLCVWGAAGVPTGSQTVNMSVTTSPTQNVSNLYGTSFTYTGVGSVGTVQSATGQFGSNAVTVPSATGDLVWGLVGNYQTGTYSSPSYTQRQSIATGGGPFFAAGDQAGAASVNFNATQSSTFHWAAVGLDLLPVSAPAVPTNAFFSML